jgi:hypothetical protein
VVVVACLSIGVAFAGLSVEGVCALSSQSLDQRACDNLVKMSDFPDTGCLCVALQPFYSTEGISRLVKEAEAKVAELERKQGACVRARRGCFSNIEATGVWNACSRACLARCVLPADGSVAHLESCDAVCAEAAAAEQDEARASEGIGETEVPLIQRTQAALGMWQELSEKASTPSTIIVQSPRKRRRT